MLDFLHLDVVIPAALGVLAGAITVLKVVAPKTKTKTDDTILARLEQLEALAIHIPVPKSDSKPTPIPENGTVVRDHR